MTATKAEQLSFLMKLKDMFMRLLRYVSDGQNWISSPKLWIWAFIAIRLILAFLRKHGLTLGKKSLSKDHVFLTGAGSGLGRFMALKLGKMGCKLSLSDINLQGVQETK